MRHTRLKTAALAIVSLPLPSLWRTPRASRSAIAPGAMAPRRKVTRRRRDWPGRDVHYMVNQLINFRTHTRDNPFSKQYMWGAAASLGPQAVHELAIYFSSLPADAANDGDRETHRDRKNHLSTGASGREYCRLRRLSWTERPGRFAEIPRLGGLAYTYLKRRLQQWGEGYHATARPPMPRIASRLSRDQIEALASYLSFVK